jgi:hypothetical protein
VLYVNDGDGTFADRTAEYGLDFRGYATQAVFFDYDGDGDLDAYLLNHSVHSERTIGARPRAGARNPRSDDRLLRNDRGPDGRPRFVDASAGAGLVPNDGFGLGVVASDVNMDGCPDLYVANDFQEDDLLYLNRCDGTFAESLGRAAGHTSRFSMGVDAADVNDDGRPDLFVGDMLPEREDVLKTSASTEVVRPVQPAAARRYRPQYARNTLQLNRGVVRDSAGGGAALQRRGLPGRRARERLELGAAVRGPRPRRARRPVRDQRDLGGGPTTWTTSTTSATTRRRRARTRRTPPDARRAPPDAAGRAPEPCLRKRATCASPTWPRRGGSRSPASATARPTSTSTTTALSTSWSTR